MNIIALDVSLKCSGVAIHDGSSTPRVRRIHPRGKYARPGPRRLLYHDEALRQILETRDGWDLAVIEDYPFGVKGKGVRSLAELGGVVRLRLHRSGIPIVEFNPSKLKILARGKGNVKKNAVAIAAVRRLDYQGDDDNEADALWLLEAARQAYRLPGAVQLPQSHLRALEGVMWPVIAPLAREFSG